MTENQEEAARSQIAPWAIWLLLAGALLLRTLQLQVWPEIQADEGLWTNSSKNYFLFGDWFLDGRRHAFLSPVFHALSVASYTLFGASIASARLVSAAAGTVSVGLIWLLAVRLTHDRWHAFVMALLMAVGSWPIFMSRTALIEATQLPWLLGAALLATYPAKRHIFAAGALFGMALLTKTNAIFFAAVVAGQLWIQTPARDRRLKAWVWSNLTFLSAAVVVAGTVNLAMYAAAPDQMAAAYAFEIEGNHFQPGGVRVGRFGLSPVLMAESAIALLREAPFMIVLGVMGFGRALALKPAGWRFFALWSLIGVGFVQLQMYQPIRYYYLALPGLLFFVAVAIDGLADGLPRGSPRWLRSGALGLVVAFNLLYAMMSRVANASEMIPAVADWVHENSEVDDRFVASGYLATDLQRRAYAYYYLADTPAELETAVDSLAIDYILWDSSEWPEWAGPYLRERFSAVKEWPFGAVFEVH